MHTTPHPAPNDPTVLEAARTCDRILDALETVIVGLLAGGYVLLEDLPGLGKTLVARSLAQVTCLSVGRVQKTTKSTLPLDITRRVAPGPGGGVMLTATIRGQPGGVMRLFNPVMRRMVERNVRKDYERLKELLDEGT